MGLFDYVVSFSFYLLPYQCHYEREKNKSPKNKEQKWSSWKFPCRLTFDKEKKNLLLVLNL